MSSDNEGHVEKKVFFNPDLMAKFLPYMDSHALLQLCRSKISCALNILQNRHNPSVWNKMINRSIPEIPFVDAIAEINLRFEEARTQILPLISLVKIMQAKENFDANLATWTILEALCEKSSDGDAEGSIQLVSPGHKSYSVTSLAFMLLEEVETSLGSTLQEIESIDVRDVDLNLLSALNLQEIESITWVADEVLPALASRVSRQRGMVTNMNIQVFFCRTKKSLDDLLILSNKTETGRLRVVIVYLLNTADAEEVFASLARAATSLKVERVQIMGTGREAREQLLQAKRVDLRTIFESLDLTGEVRIVEEKGNGFGRVSGFFVMGGWEAFERYIERERDLSMDN